MSNFLDRLERMRPDVVLVDISGWKEPLEGLVTSIRAAAGDPMIIALNTTADADAILSSLRAGINEYLYPPLQDSLKKSLEAPELERSRRREGTKGSGKSLRLPVGQGRLRRHHPGLPRGGRTRPARTKESCWPTWTWTPAWSAFITKTKSVYSILDAVNNLHRLDMHYWKALVSNGIPGVEIVSSPHGAGLQAAAQGRADPAGAGLRAAAVRLDAGGSGPQPEPYGHGGAGRDRRSLPGDHAGSAGAAPVQADHADADRQRLRQEPHQADSRTARPSGWTSRRANWKRCSGRPIFAMVPNDYPELYETYAEGRMLSRTCELGKQIAKLAAKLANLEDEKPAAGGKGIVSLVRIRDG